MDSFVDNIHKKETIRKIKLVLKRVLKPNRLIISSASSGPKAQERRPATPIMPMECANLSTGAKSEQIVIVAVMLIPHPIPVSALKITGRRPASWIRWKHGKTKIKKTIPKRDIFFLPFISIRRPKKGRIKMAVRL